MGIRDDAGAGTTFGRPLVRARRALGQLPLEAEQVFQVVVAPAGGRGGPGHFQAAGDGVGALAGAKGALPAQALQFQAGGFGFGADIVGGAGAVGLAEGVAAGDQGHGFFVVHRHAGEGFANIHAGGHRVRVALGAFRVHIDQAHLHRGQGVFQVASLVGATFFIARLGHQLALAGFLHGGFIRFAVAGVAAQPFVFRAPVDVFVRLPGIRATAGKTEGPEAHGFQGDVTGEHDQVGPGDVAAVLLLDRPQQPARLVEADVVRPAVERRETLLAGTGAATAITDAVGPGAVPGHADEQRSIVAEVGGPPVLGVGHQRMQVLFQGLEIQAFEGFGIVEVLAHGVGQGRVLVQDLQVQLVRPPVAVGRATAGGMVERAFRFVCHEELPLVVFIQLSGPDGREIATGESNDIGCGAHSSLN